MESFNVIDKPLPTNETPTSAHAALTDLLSDIRDVAMELPLMEPADKSEIPPDMSTKEGPTVQPSYEDVLATAVLNKAIQNGQKSKRKADSPMSLVDSAVQTDSEMSESSEAVSHKQYSMYFYFDYSEYFFKTFDDLFNRGCKGMGDQFRKVFTSAASEHFG